MNADTTDMIPEASPVDDDLQCQSVDTSLTGVVMDENEDSNKSTASGDEDDTVDTESDCPSSNETLSEEPSNQLEPPEEEEDNNSQTMKSINDVLSKTEDEAPEESIITAEAAAVLSEEEEKEPEPQAEEENEPEPPAEEENEPEPQAEEETKPEPQTEEEQHGNETLPCVDASQTKHELPEEIKTFEDEEPEDTKDSGDEMSTENETEPSLSTTLDDAVSEESTEQEDEAQSNDVVSADCESESETETSTASSSEDGVESASPCVPEEDNTKKVVLLKESSNEDFKKCGEVKKSKKLKKRRKGEPTKSRSLESMRTVKRREEDGESTPTSSKTREEVLEAIQRAKKVLSTVQNSPSASRKSPTSHSADATELVASSGSASVLSNGSGSGSGISSSGKKSKKSPRSSSRSGSGVRHHPRRSKSKKRTSPRSKGSRDLTEDPSFPSPLSKATSDETLVKKSPTIKSSKWSSVPALGVVELPESTADRQKSPPSAKRRSFIGEIRTGLDEGQKDPRRVSPSPNSRKLQKRRSFIGETRLSFSEESLSQLASSARPKTARGSLETSSSLRRSGQRKSQPVVSMTQSPKADRAKSSEAGVTRKLRRSSSRVLGKIKRKEKKTDSEESESKSEPTQVEQPSSPKSPVMSPRGDSRPPRDLSPVPKDLDIAGLIDADLPKGHVWSEVDCPENITYRSKDGPAHMYDIKAASLNMLVRRAAQPKSRRDAQRAEKFLHVFLTTYQSFTTPKELLNKLTDFYHVPDCLLSDPSLQTKILETRKNILSVIRLWFTEHYLDFTGEMKTFLQTFLENTKPANKEGDSTFVPHRFLEKAVAKKLKQGTYNSLFSSSMSINKPPPPKIPNNVNWKTTSIFNINAEEIARQLTIEDQHLYAEMQAVELLNLAWSKPKLKHRATNVLQLIDRFNRLSRATATSIVCIGKLKNRVTVVKFFLDVAAELKKLKNFSSLMAIVSGLNNSAVHRLKHTFAALSKKHQATHADLTKLLEGNAAAYREYVENIKPPAVPFLGVYQTDLTFIEDGNPDFIGELVNFGKCHFVFDVLEKLFKFQRDGYNLKLVPEICKLLGGLPQASDSELYKRSLEIEPRGATKKELN